MEKKYETKSLQVAAFLFTSPELKMVGFNKEDPRNIFFQFLPFEIAEKLEDEYYLDSTSCSPKKLMESYSILKEKVFQIKRNH